MVEEKHCALRPLFTQVCFVGEYVVVSGADNILRVWHIREKQLLRWRCPCKITSIAITDTQIAVATSKSNVYILHYVIENMNLQIRQKSNICLPKRESSIYQLRLSSDQDGTYTKCLIFGTSEVYLCEWNIATVGEEITQDSGNNSTSFLPGAFPQSFGNETLRQIVKDYHSYFDAIEIPKNDSSCWLLVRINEKRDTVSAELLSRAWDREPQWSCYSKDAQYYLFDISQDGWILLQNISDGQTLVVNIFSKQIYSQPHHFTSGCFLETSLTEAYFVLESSDSDSLALRIYNQNFDCLRTWSNETNYPHSGKDCGFARSIATSQNNVVKIWNNTLESHSSILIFIEDDQDQCRFNTNNTNRVNQYLKYYQPSCVRKQSRSDSKILDATYLSDAKDFFGALLVLEGGIQYIYLWISEKESFCIAPLQVDSENREVYTRVIIQKDLIAICSEFVRGSVAVQIWRRQTSNFVKAKMVWTKYSKMGRVVKLISLDLNRFCLATDNELRFFDKDNSKVNTISIDRSYIVKDIIYDIGDHRICTLCDHYREWDREWFEIGFNGPPTSDSRSFGAEVGILESGLCSWSLWRRWAAINVKTWGRRSVVQPFKLPGSHHGSCPGWW